MREDRSDLPQLPLRLGVAELLGLRDPEVSDPDRLRALQFAGLQSVSALRAIVCIVAAAAAFLLYSDVIPALQMGLWLAALALANGYGIHTERMLKQDKRTGIKRSHFLTQALSVITSGVLWGYAILAFAPHGTSSDHFALFALIVMMGAGGAVIMAAAPVATVSFLILTGLSAAASFILIDEWLFGAITLLYTGSIVWGCIALARTDIAARVAEAGVAEQGEVVSLLLREFEEGEADWLWQIDTNRRIKSVSPRFAYAMGRQPTDLEGESFVRLIAGENWESGDVGASVRELADRLKRRESFSNLLVQVHLAEGFRWWELSGTPIRDEKGAYIGYRGVGSDVTEQRESDEKIAYLARYDTLTGLPNRLMLTEALSDAMRYAEQWKTRCAFLMIDLDRFKAVNDSLGHQVGDRLLAKVSKRLRDVLTENEQGGRLGGDEFAVVIRDAGGMGKVQRIAEAVIETLSQPYIVDQHTLFIGASVGSAVGPRDGRSVETLMRNADLALYRSKDEGGGIHFSYVPAMHADAEERRKLELSLRGAIGKQELQLNFQPVVNSLSERVVSFEALLRWNSAEHGFVSPGKFIPLAEDTRLIVPIGNWVLHEACREAVRWPADIKIAVNVSGEQLLEPNFSKNVVQALADTGLPAGRLEIEVTESVFLRDGRTARQTLEEILALGCSIALDDFGTGYSSLGYLRTLRFSTIKVDRSFVQGAAQGSRESIAIIRAVVAMAESLEMETTAEGVEDLAQAEIIRKMGCTKIQGYYFGRPMETMAARELAMNRPEAA